MEKMNGDSRKNLIGLAIFLSIVFVSVLLITEAINMLDLPDPGLSGGENVETRSQAENDSENNRNHPTNNGQEPYNDYADSFEQWKERAQRRREEKKSGSFDRDYPFGDMPKNRIHGRDGNNGIISGEGGMPEGGVVPKGIPNIDISGNDALPDMPLVCKSQAIPLRWVTKGDLILLLSRFWVYRTTLLRVMVMENYYDNRWVMVQEEPVEKFEFGVNKNRNYAENSIKIKPVESSKGYMPVVSGNFEMIYDLSILEYKNSGTYFSEGIVEDFYEMKYEKPPSKIDLIYAQTEDNYPYEIFVNEYIDSIVDEVLEKCSNDYDVIYNVEQFLLNNYALNNNIQNNYQNADGITEFLINKKEGNYLDFISAYTFLCGCRYSLQACNGIQAFGSSSVSGGLCGSDIYLPGNKV